jgi:hypothetical protein
MVACTLYSTIGMCVKLKGFCLCFYNKSTRTILIHLIWTIPSWCSWLGLTRESLFEIIARSETRFLDLKFSRDFRETRESKLVARLASRESHRQKFRSENREKRVSL